MDFYHLEMYRLMNDPDITGATTIREWCRTAQTLTPGMRWVFCTLCDRARFRAATYPRQLCPQCVGTLKKRYYRSVLERIQRDCHRRMFSEVVLPEILNFGLRPDRLDATQWYSETTRRSFCIV